MLQNMVDWLLGLDGLASDLSNLRQLYSLQHKSCHNITSVVIASIAGCRLTACDVASDDKVGFRFYDNRRRGFKT